jgi:hypothetical protein
MAENSRAPSLISVGPGISNLFMVELIIPRAKGVSNKPIRPSKIV